jgi:hypothetical protein
MSDPVAATTLAYKGVESTPSWMVVVLLVLAFTCAAVEVRRRNRR